MQNYIKNKYICIFSFIFFLVTLRAVTLQLFFPANGMSYTNKLYFCICYLSLINPFQIQKIQAPMKKDTLKKILTFIVFVGLGIFFIWLSVRGLTPEQRTTVLTDMKSVFTGYRWVFLLIGMILGVISVYLRGLRAIILIEPLGHRVSRSDAYHSVMICYLANIAIPRLGEVLRCTYLQTFSKVPFQKSLGTVITERVVDTLLMGVLFLVAMLAEADKLIPLLGLDHMGDKLAGFHAGKWITVLLTIAGVALLFIVLGKFLGKTKVFLKIKEILVGLWQGLASIAHLRQPGLFILYSVLIWGCWYFMFLVGSLAFPEMLHMGNPVWIASLACVVVGTFGFIIAQGGLGAYPLLVSQVLLLYGVPYETGLAIGWVIWANETIVYVAGGLVSLIYTAQRKSVKTLPNKTEDETDPKPAK